MIDDTLQLKNNFKDKYTQTKLYYELFQNAQVILFSLSFNKIHFNFNKEVFHQNLF